jgi:hypothetical protein
MKRPYAIRKRTGQFTTTVATYSTFERSVSAFQRYLGANTMRAMNAGSTLYVARRSEHGYERCSAGKVIK